MPPFEPASVADAREVLPAWVVWGGDALFVGGSLLISVTSTWLAIRLAARPLVRARHAAWVERARLAYPPRYASHFAGLFFPIVVLCAGLNREQGISPLPRGWLAGLTAVVVALLLVLLHCRLERRIGYEHLTFSRSLRSVAARALLMFPHLLIAFAAAPFVPYEFNAVALLSVSVVVLAALGLAAGGNLYLLRGLGLARRASPRLSDIARRAAAPSDVVPRRVDEVDWALANALAFPAIQCVAFTPTAERQLTDDELVAVCRHELGHLHESKWALAARLSTASLLTLLIVTIRPVWGTFGPLGLLGSFLVFVVVCRIFARFSQKMETHADSSASEGDTEKGTFPRALERIYEINLAPAVFASRQLTHPDLYDRLIAAGIEPSYPRPDPPSRLRTRLAVGMLVAPVIVAAVTFLFAVVVLEETPADDERTQQWGLSLNIDPARFLSRLGLIRLEQQQYAGAIILLSAATDLDPTSWRYPLHLGQACFAAREYDKATQALATARERIAGTPEVPIAGPVLDSLAEAIDAARGSPRRPNRPPVRALEKFQPDQPAGDDPPQVDLPPAPDAAPPPDDDRPWRRRGRGRGRGRGNRPMAGGE